MGIVILFPLYIVLLCLQVRLSTRHSGSAALERTLRVEMNAMEAVLTSQTGEQQVQHQQHDKSILPIKDVYMTETITISYFQVQIRYPARAFQRLEAKKALLVTGVLSSSNNFMKRDAIRSTWAYGRSPTDVFFIVSGEWTRALQREANEHQDIVWIDDDERYRKVTWKTLSFLRAVHSWIGSAQHILKTDDDSYVNLGAIEKFVESNQADYVGYCMQGQSAEPRARQLLEEEYPMYASGAGYLISKDFLSCIDDLTDRWPSVIAEDANTGILARECKVSCQHQREVYPWRDMKHRFHITKEEPGWIHHYVKAPEEMTFIHAKVCASEHADTKSCLPGSDQSVPDSLPVFCGHWRQVDNCSQCLEFEENGFDERPEDLCSESCFICPFATENSKCIHKSEECRAPDGRLLPPDWAEWGPPSAPMNEIRQRARGRRSRGTEEEHGDDFYAEEKDDGGERDYHSSANGAEEEDYQDGGE